MDPLNPPATSTLPLASEIPRCPERENDSPPVAFQFFAALSYTSAFSVKTVPLVPPPVTSTSPLASKVAAWLVRPAFKAPVRDHKPVAGSYSSDGAPTPSPPVTCTLPFGSNEAVCVVRGTCIEPVGVQSCVFGSYSSALDSRSLALSPPVTRTLPSDNKVAVY